MMQFYVYLHTVEKEGRLSYSLSCAAYLSDQAVVFAQRGFHNVSFKLALMVVLSIQYTGKQVLGRTRSMTSSQM